MSGAGQVAMIAHRSVRRSLRQPAVVVPTLVFPLILLAVNAAGLDDAARLPGFPDDSYLDFAIAVAFMQGGLFAATVAGTELAYDVETGFQNRLALTPLHQTASLLGQLAGAVSVAMVGAVVYLVVGLAAGVQFEAGAAGVAVVLALSLLIAVALASLGAWLGLRTGSGEAVQGAFPLLFFLFFLSTMNLPKDLIEVEWFRTVATWNPISYMIDGLRGVIISDFDGTALWRGFAAAGGVAVVGFALATSALRTRMERT